MKIRILFIFLWGTLGTAYAQSSRPEALTPRMPLWGPVTDVRINPPDFPPCLHFKVLSNSCIDNPAIRYAIQNLKKETADNEEVHAAIRTLIRYAENVRLKHNVEYLRDRAWRMARREKALAVVRQQVELDSIISPCPPQDSLSEDSDTYLDTDLYAFFNYLRTDSNYLWLRHAYRDSVLLEIANAADQSIQCWINNDKTSFYRFWAANRYGDTVGTWVQVLPQGNRLKIYLDDDVYQMSAIDKKEMDTVGSVPNRPGRHYFSIRAPQVSEIARHYWTYYSEVEIAMSQGKLANWASGGENSLSLLSNIRYFANYNRRKTSWENWIHYRFGFLKTGGEAIRKNEDRFEFNSKLGQQAFKHWYYTAQFNMLTQLFNSYDYPDDEPKELVANFLSPGYFILSLGLDFKPNSDFSLVLSPIAGKWNVVRDTAFIDPERYGISEPGKRYKWEAGAQMTLNSSINNFFNVMDMTNEVKLFMSYDKNNRYVNLGKEDERKKRIPLTFDWKLTLSFKINYFMSASIYTETIYDENYSRKLQFKENLNLGVKFRF